MSGDTVTLGVVERWCHQYERALRGSFASEENPQGALPKEWEERLGELPLDTLSGATRRFGQLCRWYGERQATQRDGKARAVDPDTAKEAARALLARDPVYIVLAGRRVAITSRSYAAMAEISAHDLAIRRLTEDLTDIARLYARGQKKRRLVRRAFWRRRLKRLQQLHSRIYTEILAHRRAIYAHALTEHGGRAQDDAREAPTWWHELTPEDDARLILALLEAGPLRYARMGEPERKPRDKPTEDFGFMTVLASWERTLKLRPAELYDADLAQTLAAVRSAAPSWEVD